MSCLMVSTRVQLHDDEEYLPGRSTHHSEATSPGVFESWVMSEYHQMQQHAVCIPGCRGIRLHLSHQLESVLTRERWQSNVVF